MRLRKIANADAIIEGHSDVVMLEPVQYKGKWNEVFGNDHPIHIEVGMGKGQFVSQMALLNPDINYIGIEVVPSVIIRAIEKVKELSLPNIRLMCVDANLLSDIFNKGEIDRIYLNFSDPWPKSRHEKRRLTFKTFLDVFHQVVVENGEIHFKTDNQGLFEYSLVSLTNYGMLLQFVSLDLHNSTFEDNVMTEYEERFVNLKQRIYRLEARFNDQPL